MAVFTSASERLEKLFANQSRPPKPDPVETNSEEPEKATVEPATKPSVNVDKSLSNDAQTGQLPCNNDRSGSDDDDEYVAAFYQKPEMKTLPIRLPPTRGPSAVNKIPPTHDGESEPIEYVPSGKKSIVEFYEDDEEASARRESTTYDGNGRALAGQYCVFGLLAKFPYKYMKDPDDKVSRQFFANNKFYDRKWTLHYIHSPASFTKGAILLVPFDEAQNLIDKISTAFKIDMTVPPFPFTLDFYDDETPQPTRLGISRSRQEVNELAGQIPVAPLGYGECPSTASADLRIAYEAYQSKVEMVALANKGKSSGSRQKKAKRILQTLQESRNQLKRAERYFGLRPRTRPAASLSDQSWNEDEMSRKNKQVSCGLFIEFLNVDKPAQYAFEFEPVIIAIDVESYERNHSFITEVGISVLDTLDLVDVSPGIAGENWVKHIRSRHFRIKGREHLVNKDFCVGNPNGFDFGESEFVGLDEISDTVDRCFEWPFSVGYNRHEPGKVDDQLLVDNTAIKGAPAEMQKGSKERDLVLLGHNVGTDLDYLRDLGSEIFGSPVKGTASPSDSSTKKNRHVILTSILETLDTATLYQTFKMEPQPRSLVRICGSLGIDAWSPHNAGNDARYTLEVLVKLVISARLDEDARQRVRDPSSTGVVEDDWEAENMRRIDERIESAREKMARKFADQNIDDCSANNESHASGHCNPEEGENEAKGRETATDAGSSWSSAPPPADTYENTW